MSRFPFGIPGIKAAEERKSGSNKPQAAAVRALSAKAERTPEKKNLSRRNAFEYEQQILEYEEVLGRYISCIEEYKEHILLLKKKPEDNHLPLIQATLDLKSLNDLGRELLELVGEARTENEAYTKQLSEQLQSQERKTAQLQENLVTTLIDVNYKLDGMDKNIVARLTEVNMELHKQALFLCKQNHTENQSGMEALKSSVRRNHRILWVVFAMQFIGLGAMAFIILYLMEILPF